MERIVITEKLKYLISKLPSKSGVYLMKNAKGQIIYVGKAVSLKNRVRQYFQSQTNMQDKVKAMVSHIDEFEYIVTDSEMEALILENNLIKEYKPPYNILLRDDKTYPYIKITLNEDYPRVLKTRRVERDKAKYFGPYSNAFVVNDIIDIIHETFKIRTCRKNIQKSIEKHERPCLNYHIKTCVGPCTGKIKKQDYMFMIEKVIEFLEAKDDSIIQSLKEQMMEASKNMQYEKAIVLRDQISGIKKMLEKQKIVSASNNADRDFLAVKKDQEIICIFMFFVRDGKVVGTENFIFDDKEDKYDEREVFQSFLKQYYISAAFVPKEIYTNMEMDDTRLLEEFLTKKKKSNVSIKLPLKGEKKDMIELVEQNALETIKRKKAIIIGERAKIEAINQELKKILGIKGPVSKIESYDISNIQGVDSVGGQVVFIDTKKQPKLYRRYKIKTVEGPDDYKSMREILSRRIKHQDLPDLILLDGGKGQVSAVRKLFEQENINVPVFGMYKDDNHRTMGLCSDRELYELDKHTKLFTFISSIQEEVHRYAIDFHKSLRDSKISKSVLDDIKGVGSKRKMALFAHFKTIENIKNAKIQDLLEVENIDKKTAETIYNYFRFEKNINKPE